nr:hypothetical protein CFP56_60812 [Quercus suber]
MFSHLCVGANLQEASTVAPTVAINVKIETYSLEIGYLQDWHLASNMNLYVVTALLAKLQFYGLRLKL